MERKQMAAYALGAAMVAGSFVGTTAVLAGPAPLDVQTGEMVEGAETVDGSEAVVLDTVADVNRAAEALNTPPQLVSFARKSTVSLNNVSEITPPE